MSSLTVLAMSAGKNMHKHKGILILRVEFFFFEFFEFFKVKVNPIMQFFAKNVRAVNTVNVNDKTLNNSTKTAK